MINEKAKDKLIVALDYNNMEDAKRLIEIIGDNVSIYKVGLESYLNTEGKLIDYLHEKGKKVFLDLKFHDIENTVKMACESAIRKKVFMFNIHCSNGSKTMSEVAKMVKNSNSESLLIGVTILTNLGQEDIEEIFKSNLKLEELILNMANIAKNSNMNGVVCSPHESKIIKEKLGSDFITVCPGVRPKFTLDSKGNSNDDQNRIMTPYDAIKNKVDFIVIGRPITKSENPLQSTKLILEEISKAL
ncbi:MAG: orotidine-5'-phosphate decarboxylase [Leptotrichiaceae bacterium]|nr:orotidine-5'-phosphate decarboxylase [Leptotrichiaceae bacterium]MBP6280852.1 orotidine-5'-phosphate decarboxylase [Leptotrichiaceae bacterium]MBP7100676.1 orotidine-5'-phosphate decarboxylase [Leptotrichiaceae bacterium]MBP7739320.1 orotidine-5'-phosphate decarboxylase [Leptotrichiaceae bacterium]MBP9629308.1 orotidine-5'-phosphate decarboxylase [Leptotrichiaceae bacterium]